MVAYLCEYFPPWHGYFQARVDNVHIENSAKCLVVLQKEDEVVEELFLLEQLTLDVHVVGWKDLQKVALFLTKLLKKTPNKIVDKLKKITSREFSERVSDFRRFVDIFVAELYECFVEIHSFWISFRHRQIRHDVKDVHVIWLIVFEPSETTDILKETSLTLVIASVLRFSHLLSLRSKRCCQSHNQWAVSRSWSCTSSQMEFPRFSRDRPADRVIEL